MHIPLRGDMYRDNNKGGVKYVYGNLCNKETCLCCLLIFFFNLAYTVILLFLINKEDGSLNI